MSNGLLYLDLGFIGTLLTLFHSLLSLFLIIPRCLQVITDFVVCFLYLLKKLPAVLFELFLVSKVYNWAQEKFGAKSGGCCGCVIGVILFFIMIMVVLKIVFNVDWTSISF